MADQVGSAGLHRDPATVAQLQNALFQMIGRGHLRPGDRINEVRLSRAFGVSRGPLREAARMLEAEGLLVSAANRGFSVFAGSVQDIVHLYALKPHLDQAFYADLVDQTDSATLGDLAAKIDTLPRHDPANFAEALLAFRRATYRQIRNRALERHANAFARRDFALTPVLPGRLARERMERFTDTLRAAWREVCARNAAGAAAILAADAAAMRAALGSAAQPPQGAPLPAVAH